MHKKGDQLYKMDFDGSCNCKSFTDAQKQTPGNHESDKAII